MKNVNFDGAWEKYLEKEIERNHKQAIKRDAENKRDKRVNKLLTIITGIIILSSYAIVLYEFTR